MMVHVQSVAALYDIHGNRPALDAALAEVERQDVDRILIGGDIVLGPMPRETLARVRALGDRAILIRGNCDRLVADPHGVAIDHLPSNVRDVVIWTAEQLSADERAFLGELPMTVTLTVAGIGDVLFCHATPRSDDELFTVQSTDEQLAPMFDGVTAPLVVCGHTHMQFDRRRAASGSSTRAAWACRTELRALIGSVSGRASRCSERRTISAPPPPRYGRPTTRRPSHSPAGMYSPRRRKGRC
jgi:predicted phosphodiesterase